MTVTASTENSSRSSNRVSCILPANLTKQERTLKWIPISTQEDLEQIRANPSGNFFLCQSITLQAVPNPTTAKIVADEQGKRDLTHIPLPLPKNNFHVLFGLFFDSGAFNGIFDGNGKTISGLSMPKFVVGDDVEFSPSYSGLFYRIGASGIVRNLRVYEPKMRVGDRSGVIAGENHGTISNVVISGRGFIQQPPMSGGLSYVYNLGGIVGANYGKILNSSIASDFSVLGYDQVGGIVGSCAPWLSGQPVIKNTIFRGALTIGERTFSQNYGGIVALSTNCLIDSSHSLGRISGGIYTGGLIGTIANSSIIQDSTVNGSVLGAKGVGGLVGAISEYAPEMEERKAMEAAAVKIVRSGFNGILGGIERRESSPNDYLPRTAVGGLIGVFEDAPLTAARYPGLVMWAFPLVIDSSYATGEFDLPSPTGFTNDRTMTTTAAPLNSFCGGFIGATNQGKLTSINFSYADMKPARWVFDTPQTLPGLNGLPALTSDPVVSKLGLTGGTCQQIGGIVGDGFLIPWNAVFNRENLPAEHFLAEGANGPRYGFSPAVFDALKQYIKPLSSVDAQFGISQKELLSLDTFISRRWSIAPAGKVVSPAPTWRFDEGSYPYLNY
jgi:hypothetical protein